MNYTIQNCPHRKGCPGDWQALQDTGLPRVRLCPECARNVLAVDDEPEQREALRDGRIYATAGLLR